MDFPVPIRKRNRLENYDYSQGGAYVVTICTQYKRCIFGYVCDGDDGPVMVLNETGKLIERTIQCISLHYPTVEVSRFCVMPNHVHLLLMFDTDRENPALSTVVNQFKGAVTKALGKPIWQKNYHDVIVRNLREFQRYGEYIEHNAAKWKIDRNYAAEG